jgi:hypothetical protein
VTPKVEGDCRVADVQTLRDVIALALLPVLMTRLALDVTQTCEAAYDWADAFLAVRERRQPPRS